jgi:ketosteroid isomerase-like protein
MSEQPRIVRILERGYTMIWEEGRVEEALRSLDDDFEWVVTDYLDGAVRHGPDAVIEFFREWMDAWADLQVDWKITELGPERALVETDMRGRSSGTGIPGEMRVGQIWEMENGRFRRMTMYGDLDQARRAAGLDPP